jgi:hypothetical protein
MQKVLEKELFSTRATFLFSAAKAFTMGAKRKITGQGSDGRFLPGTYRVSFTLVSVNR